jgi:membrane protein DedA with SNARE-associated domain
LEALTYSTHITYLSVGLFLVLGSMGLPFPEEIVLLSAGYLAGMGIVRFWLMLPFTMATVIFGDAITYSFGRNFIIKWGKYIFFPIHRLERIETYYKRHGSKTVFFKKLLENFGPNSRNAP